MRTSLDRADLDRFDRAAAKVARWSRERFEHEMRAASREDQPNLALLRYRYRIDDFRRDIMVPIWRESGPVSPPNELDRIIYGIGTERWTNPRPTVQHLVMTGRGVGKTTRAQVRAMHSGLYGWSRLALALGSSDGDAVEWIETVRQWLDTANEGGVLGDIWPEQRVEGDQHNLRIVTRFGPYLLRARGFTSSLRGTKVGDIRPDTIYPDDIESEEGSVSQSARNNTQSRLTSKVLPLGNQQGGLQVIWPQTPVHPDAVAARIATGHPELRGWSHSALPVITRWPDREDLWSEAEQLYFDADAEPDAEERERLVRRFYEERAEEMDRGAEVLDAVRMGPVQCYLKRWQVGPSAFQREYEMRSRTGTSSLDLSRCPRVTVVGDVPRILREDHEPVPCTTVPLHAHLDPADGGDDAALVIAARVGGRVIQVGGKVWEGTSLAVVLQELPDVLRPFHLAGLDALHWEPPSGSRSVVEQQLRRKLDKADLHRVDLVAVPSSTNKEGRIMATLEPLMAGGLLGVLADLPPRIRAQVEAFDHRRRNNRDDWLDAMQRCAEALLGLTDDGHESPTAGELYDALDALPAGGVW